MLTPIYLIPPAFSYNVTLTLLKRWDLCSLPLNLGKTVTMVDMKLYDFKEWVTKGNRASSLSLLLGCLPLEANQPCGKGMYRCSYHNLTWNPQAAATSTAQNLSVWLFRCPAPAFELSQLTLSEGEMNCSLSVLLKMHINQQNIYWYFKPLSFKVVCSTVTENQNNIQNISTLILCIWLPLTFP